MIIALSREEMEVLSGVVNKVGLSLNRDCGNSAAMHTLAITADEADEYRNLCQDALEIFGFDDNYNPTGIGLVLEVLIDKLYSN